MRILTSSLICAALLCEAVSLRADDNAAQATARAALMQKMQEMDSQSNSAAISPAPENQAPPAVTPVPENTPPPVATPSAAEPTPQTATPTEVPSGPTPADVEPQTQPAPDETAPMATAPAVASPTNENSPEAEEQAIIARHMAQAAPPATNSLPAMNEMAPPPPQTEMPVQQHRRGFFSHILHPFHSNAHPAVVVEQRMQPAAQNYAAKNNSGFAPITPPPPPVSPEQDAELQVLLQKYKADQISPEEYQTERAAIIGTR